jgi:hypothetical protein
VCPFGEAERLVGRFTAAPRKALIAMEGGVSEGEPCEAFAHHGYNGVEHETVTKIAGWIVGEAK